MYKTLTFYFLFAVMSVFGSSATVTWEANPELDGSEMRIYQVSHTDENIVGYSSIEYSANAITFEIMDDCMGVYGRVYQNGLLSEDSNALIVPVTSSDSYDPNNPAEACITAFSANELTFNVVADKEYRVYSRASLSSGDWEPVGDVLSASRNGALIVAIDTSANSSCFYTVVPVS